MAKPLLNFFYPSSPDSCSAGREFAGYRDLLYRTPFLTGYGGRDRDPDRRVRGRGLSANAQVISARGRTATSRLT